MSGAVLTAMAESISLEYVISKVMNFAFSQKSPKVQSESLMWISNTVKECGLQANPKTFMDDMCKAVQSTNLTVRVAAITTVGLLSVYMGDSVMHYFDSEKPALRQQIQAEMDKNASLKPVAKPTANKKAKEQ